MVLFIDLFTLFCDVSTQSIDYNIIFPLQYFIVKEYSPIARIHSNNERWLLYILIEMITLDGPYVFQIAFRKYNIETVSERIL